MYIVQSQIECKHVDNKVRVRASVALSFYLFTVWQLATRYLLRCELFSEATESAKEALGTHAPILFSAANKQLIVSGGTNVQGSEQFDGGHKAMSSEEEREMQMHCKGLCGELCVATPLKGTSLKLNCTDQCHPKHPNTGGF